MPMPGTKLIIYSLKQYDGGATWIRHGNAFVNRDDSITIWLDSLPLQHKLHLREKPAAKAERRDEPEAGGERGPVQTEAELAGPVQ